MKRFFQLTLALSCCAALLPLASCSNDNVSISTINNNSLLYHTSTTIGDTSVEVYKNQAWSEAGDLDTDGARLEINPDGAISGRLSIKAPGNASEEIAEESSADSESAPQQ